MQVEQEVFETEEEEEEEEEVEADAEDDDVQAEGNVLLVCPVPCDDVFCCWHIQRRMVKHLQKKRQMVTGKEMSSNYTMQLLTSD